jgi:type 1 glutamine amidotransferase
MLNLNKWNCFATKFGLMTFVVGTLSFAQSPIRVLFWGGTTTTTHNSRALRDTLTPVFAANNLTLNYREATSHSWLNPDSLAQYDVAFLYTTDQTGTDMSATQLSNFISWIAAGHVAVAFHGSTNTYLNNGTLSANWGNLLGGLFLDHGNGTSDNGGTITFKQPLHASLTGTTALPTSATATGGQPYWDEGRRHKSFTSDTIILARSRMNTVDTATPWIWVRAQGNGWVYYNCSGHDGQTWKRPEFKGQVVQAIKWGAGIATTGLRGRAALQPLLDLHQSQIAVPFDEPHTVRITDMTGKKVFFRSGSKASNYDLSPLPQGAYYLEVLISNKGAFRSLYLQKP